MPDILDEFESIPVGSLGIIAMHGCEELGSKIDSYLVQWRAQRENEHKSTIAFAGYQRDTYLINAVCPALERVKQRALSVNRCADTIYTLYPMCSTTAAHIKCTAKKSP